MHSLQSLQRSKITHVKYNRIALIYSTLINIPFLPSYILSTHWQSLLFRFLSILLVNLSTWTNLVSSRIIPVLADNHCHAVRHLLHQINSVLISISIVLADTYTLKLGTFNFCSFAIVRVISIKKSFKKEQIAILQIISVFGYPPYLSGSKIRN